jgi:hypothetical protein
MTEDDAQKALRALRFAEDALELIGSGMIKNMEDARTIAREALDNI